MSINVSEVIWTIVCFFALLFVLKKFLFDPLVRFMEARQASIDEGHEKRPVRRSSRRTRATLRCAKAGKSAARRPSSSRRGKSSR